MKTWLSFCCGVLLVMMFLQHLVIEKQKRDLQFWHDAAYKAVDIGEQCADLLNHNSTKKTQEDLGVAEQ